jgi:hydrogenase maturation protein HypF
VGTFRPLALAGGDRAIREPWRLALALLLDACGGDLPPEAHVLLGGVPRQQQSQVRRLLEAPARLSKARGVGRYFDAFGALFLDRPSASFEGQIALEWNQAADPAVRRCYPFDIDSGEFPEADLRQTVLAALQDWRLGEAISAISAAFHNTLAEATVALVKHAVASRGERPIVLTGGCFQNARLAEAVSAALTPELDVYLHHEVPPGDGGIALGQAVAADAIVHGE